MKIIFELDSVDEIPAMQLLLEQMLMHKNLTDTNQSVDSLGLTVREQNCLKASGVYTVSQLLAMSANDLLKTSDVGLKKLTGIADALQKRGLKLRD